MININKKKFKQEINKNINSYTNLSARLEIQLEISCTYLKEDKLARIVHDLS